MPENRGKNGQFIAGNSANPGGRPKIPDEVREATKAACPKAVAVLVALLDDKKPAIRLEAAKTILDRAYGKPVQMQAVAVENDASQDFHAYIRQVIMENVNDGG